MEELNLGHHPRKDLIHKELQLRMPKESYENLNEKNKLLFLAGLFDGEGSFGVWGKGNGRKSFQCSVEMCDRDSVKKFADFFGGNVVKKSANFFTESRSHDQHELVFPVRLSSL